RARCRAPRAQAPQEELMPSPAEQAMALVRLATNNPEKEEADSAAREACRRIMKHGLLIVAPLEEPRTAGGAPGPVAAGGAAPFSPHSPIWDLFRIGVDA